MDKKRVVKALEKIEEVAKAFCPTGPGGGVDPSCSPNTGGGSGGGRGGLSPKAERAYRLSSTAEGETRMSGINMASPAGKAAINATSAAKVGNHKEAAWFHDHAAKLHETRKDRPHLIAASAHREAGKAHTKLITPAARVGEDEYWREFSREQAANARRPRG